jgi:predicted cupin superfamily sugar epimerase
MMLTGDDVIRMLGLIPLPGEGGFFRETYRSTVSVPSSCLGDKYNDVRRIGTAIFYCLTPETFSSLHRLPGDEIFHFYLGDAVEMLQLHPDGNAEVITIGCDIVAGWRPQVLVPGGSWQGSRLVPGGRFALMGTTMAPGFEFIDYQNGSRKELTSQFPKHAELISKLTRD